MFEVGSATRAVRRAWQNAFLPLVPPEALEARDPCCEGPCLHDCLMLLQSSRGDTAREGGDWGGAGAGCDVTEKCASLPAFHLS